MIPTLEQFLQLQCGMAPPPLVEYYEEHREFVEQYLANYCDLNISVEEWEDAIEDLWLLLPEPPTWFKTE